MLGDRITSEIAAQELFSSSPSFREYDREFTKLIEDIPSTSKIVDEFPRTTSAPPYLGEARGAYAATLEHYASIGLDPSALTGIPEQVPVPPLKDIRLDEHYNEFYRTYSGTRKLPPPLENRQLYNELLPNGLHGLQHRQPAPQHGPVPVPNHVNPPSNLYSHLVGQQRAQQSQGNQLGQMDAAVAAEILQNHLQTANSVQRMQQAQNIVSMPGNGPVANIGYGAGVPPVEHGLRQVPGMGVQNMQPGMIPDGLHNGLPGTGAPQRDPAWNGNPASRVQHMQYSDNFNGMQGGQGQQVSVESVAAALQVLGLTSGVNPSMIPNGMNSSMNPAGLNPNVNPNGLTPSLTPTGLTPALTPSMSQGGMNPNIAPSANQGGLNPSGRPLMQEGLHAPMGVTNGFPLMPNKISPSAVDNRAASIITSEASLLNYQGEGNQVNFQGGGVPPPAPLPCPPGAAPEVYQAAYAAAFYAQQSRMAQQMAHQQHPTPETTGAPGNMNAAAGAFPSTPGQISVQTAPPVIPSVCPPSAAVDTATGTSSSPTNSSTINICRYFAQGYCTQGEGCNFSHAQGPAPTAATATSRRAARGSKAARNEHNELLDAEGRVKFTAIEEVNGQVLSLAQDQHGCRFLQKKIDEGGPEAVAAIFAEVLQCVVELMVDPFGNYLVQKLLECCSEGQRVQILQAVSEPAADGMPKVIGVALNTHGTRAVQKLVETLRSTEQVQLAIQALEPGVVPLIKDLNGNHVVQRCLQRLGAVDSQFIYNAAGRHCVEIGTHRHGCCVLQRCVDHATGPQREHLVSEIATNALALAQDPFGNYVVQYVLELGMATASSKVIRALAGEYAPLSLQKFSSNVVEKCLKLGGPELEEDRKIIVREIMVSPHLGRLLQDAYGNYVVQSALAIAKGDLHCELVEHIRPHLTAIKSSPYGKRILARSHLLQKKSAAGG